LIVFLFCLAQIPVLPLVTCLFANWDRGHEVLISENHGVLTITLRHHDYPKPHGAGLDLFIGFDAQQESDKDHKLSFSRSVAPSDSFRKTLDHIVGVFYCVLPFWSDKSMVKINHTSPLVIHHDRVQRINSIPPGLRQIVLLV
jgi:hypothetical protein